MAEYTVPENEVAKTSEESPTQTREARRYITPAVDIYENQDGLTLVFDMPGVKNEDLEIQVFKNILTLKSNVSLENRENKAHVEFQLQDYFRQFKLHEEVDSEKISADLKHGVLTVHLPKPEEAKPKKIKINVPQ